MFHRVAAHCVRPRYAPTPPACPGGYSVRPTILTGWTNETLCDAAPVFQRAEGGAVLYRTRRGQRQDGSRTAWCVAPISYGRVNVLEICGSNGHDYTYSQISSPLPPDAPGYGWSVPSEDRETRWTGSTNGASVHIVAQLNGVSEADVAVAPCTDVRDGCDQMVTSGFMSCAVDFIPTGPMAGLCDRTCAFCDGPSGGYGGGTGR
eukprot:COSAG02_NODE_9824_length_2100_cov_1.034983_1_plen_205_part_00